MNGTDLFSQQESNRRRSAWLTAGFVVFFAWIGLGGDLVRYLMAPDRGFPVPWLGMLTAAAAGGIAWYSWRRGPERVLGATGAHELLHPGTPGEVQLANVVEEMAIASGTPRPRIWIVPEDDPNAFATGRDASSASVAVTRGLLDLLDRDELQGVVAHEMAHIRNLDVRLMTLLAAMVGALALMSDTLRVLLRRGGGMGRGGRGRGGGGTGSPLALVVLVLWLLSLLVAPLVGRVLALAVSRKREYLADATAAQFTRNPLALARALTKLEERAEPTRTISRGAAHLCIVDPGSRRLSNREGRLGDLLASHPPLRVRVARLKAMGYSGSLKFEV